MTQLLSIVELVAIGFAIGYGTKKALQAFDWFLEKRRL